MIAQVLSEAAESAVDGRDCEAGRVLEVVQTKARGMVRRLRVDHDGHRIVLHGQCSSFHAKQLVSVVVLGAAGDVTVFNELVVNRTGSDHS